MSNSNNTTISSVTPSYRNNGKIQMELSVPHPISAELLEEIVTALQNVGGYGSIEIIVQDYSVTQITVRKIKKTKHILAE